MHTAVERGNAELAQRLLDLGADPNLRDARFSSTPLDWANHLAQPELVELLESVTAQGAPQPPGPTAQR